MHGSYGIDPGDSYADDINWLRKEVDDLGRQLGCVVIAASGAATLLIAWLIYLTLR